MQSSNSQYRYSRWGTTGDIATAADYDGDGQTDIAIYRASAGEWYILPTANTPYRYYRWRIAEDIPVAADYDGDGRADVAVWRPSSGTWYLLQSTAGFTGVQFGQSGDKPAEATYVR